MVKSGITGTSGDTGGYWGLYCISAICWIVPYIGHTLGKDHTLTICRESTAHQPYAGIPGILGGYRDIIGESGIPGISGIVSNISHMPGYREISGIVTHVSTINWKSIVYRPYAGIPTICWDCNAYRPYAGIPGIVPYIGLKLGKYRTSTICRYNGDMGDIRDTGDSTAYRSFAGIILYTNHMLGYRGYERISGIVPYIGHTLGKDHTSTICRDTGDNGGYQG